MEVRERKERAPARTQPASMRGVVSVIGADGSASPETDPKLPTEQVLALYRTMVRARLADGALGRLAAERRIGFWVPCHGLEAALVGAAWALGDGDMLFPDQRALGAVLARGLPLHAVMDQAFGTVDDRAKARQVPGAFTGKPWGIASAGSPTAGHLTHATGFAWAARMKGRDAAAAALFGAGAAATHELHTALNFAGVFRAPVLFLCRNDRWGTRSAVARGSALEAVADHGIGYGVPGVRCDGGDALAVYRTVRDARARAAAGEGPTLVEMLVPKPGETTDGDGVLVRLRRHLLALGAWDEARDKVLRAEIAAEVEACVEAAAMKSPPSPATLTDDVFGR